MKNYISILSIFFVFGKSYSQTCYEFNRYIYKIMYYPTTHDQNFINNTISYVLVNSNRYIQLITNKSGENVKVFVLFFFITDHELIDDTITIKEKACGDFWIDYNLKDLDTTLNLLKNVSTMNVSINEDDVEFWGSNPTERWDRVKQLPPKLEKRLRAECKKKNIDIDYFLGPEKPSIRTTTKGVNMQRKGKK